MGNVIHLGEEFQRRFPDKFEGLDTANLGREIKRRFADRFQDVEDVVPGTEALGGELPTVELTAPEVKEQGLLNIAGDVASEVGRLGVAGIEATGRGVLGTVEGLGAIPDFVATKLEEEATARTARNNDLRTLVGLGPEEPSETEAKVQNFVTDGLRRVGSEVREFAKWAAGDSPPEARAGESFLEKPELLLDPDYVINLMGEGVGSMAAMLAVGSVTGPAIQGNLAAGALFESIVEAGGNYTEAIEQHGASKEQAADIFTATIRNTFPTTAALNAVGLGNSKIKGAAKALFSGVAEGAQEGIQQIGARAAIQQELPEADISLTEGLERAVLGGALSGGVVGTALGAADTAPSKPVEAPKAPAKTAEKPIEPPKPTVEAEEPTFDVGEAVEVRSREGDKTGFGPGVVKEIKKTMIGTPAFVVEADGKTFQVDANEIRKPEPVLKESTIEEGQKTITIEPEQTEDQFIKQAQEAGFLNLEKVKGLFQKFRAAIKSDIGKLRAPKEVAELIEETPPVIPEQPRVKVEDVDPEEFLNFDKLRISDEEKLNLRRLVSEKAAIKDAPKQRIGFEQIREEAKEIHPRVLLDLKRPGKGETLNPATRLALRERVNTINDLSLKKSKQLQKDRLDLAPQQILRREAEIEILERDAKGMLDVLIPTRSQDGRNLVYHKIMAEKSFDSEFWIARARRKAGGTLDQELEIEIQRELSKAREAKESGNAQDVERAQRKLSELFNKTERTGLLDTLSALRKAGLLTGIKTQIRNIGGNTSFAAIRELAKEPASVADMAMGVFTGRRTVAGLSADANRRAFREAATRGAKEAAEVIRTGGTTADLERFDLNREINSGSKVVDLYVNGVFRMMSAGDKPFRAFAYRRALEERARVIALNEARAGKISRSNINKRARELADKPTEGMRAEAIADSEVAVFAEETSLTKAISGFRARLKPGGRFIMDLAIPFQRTPTNIVTQLLEFAGVSPKGISAAADVIVNKSMTATQQKAIAEAIGKGVVGQALIMLGWYLAGDDQATGVSPDTSAQRALDEAAGRLPGSIRVGDKWRQISTFSPAGNLVTIGATFRMAEHKETDEAKIASAVATATRTVLDQPLLTGAQDIIQALEDPATRGSFVAQRTIGSFVPTIVADVGRALDPIRRSTRKEGVTASAKERLPFVRKNLPKRLDVLGQEMEQSPISAIDPTIGVKDRTKGRPGLKEMVRLRVGTGFPVARKIDGEKESNEELHARTAYTGRVIEGSVNDLVASADYQVVEDPDKALQIKSTITAAKREVNKILKQNNFKELDKESRIALLTQLALNEELVVSVARKKRQP